MLPGYQKATIQELQGLQFKNVFLSRLRQWQMVHLAYNECQNTDTRNPTPKTPHATHTGAICMCGTHMQRRERREKTMVLAVRRSTFLGHLSYFLLSLRYSKEEEEVTTSKIFIKPSSEHNVFRCISIKIIKKSPVHYYRL